MGQFKDKKAVSSLLREAILQLCRVSVGMQGNFTIDGIICIGSGEREDQEFIVKIHEKAVCGPENPAQPTSSEILKSMPDSVTPASTSVNPLVSLSQTEVPSHSRMSFPNNSNKQSTDHFDTVSNHIPLAVENDVEILDIPSVASQKQMFGDIDNFSDIECTGCDFDDISISDVVIKPDPGMFTKVTRNNLTNEKCTNSADDSSDEELKIETLKAGRVRKRNRAAYTDIDGAPVQVLSAEEFKRILKSEKLKRSRDKSPDFVNPAKAFRTTSDSSAFYRRQIPVAQKVTGKLLDKEPLGSHTWNPPVSNTTSAANIVKYKLPQHYGKQLQRNVASKPVSQIQNENNTTVNESNSLQITYPMNTQVGNSYGTDSKLQTVSALPVHSQSTTTLNKFPDTSQPNHSAVDANGTSPETLVHTASGSESILTQRYNALTQGSNQELNGDNNVICLDVVNKATQSKVHECPVCANVFDTFRHLDLHMYRLHPGMFLCPVCGKSFKQRSTRNRHIVALHSSEKNFICHICNASFTRTDTLKKHFDMHHPDVAFPKKSYSYAKGMSILSADQIPVSTEAIVVQDHGKNLANHNLYAENFITPIQVTAAVESTEAVHSVVLPSTANITNITPYIPDAGGESEERCHSSNSMKQISDQESHQSDINSDKSGESESKASFFDRVPEKAPDGTKISLHSVTHVKPIDLTRQLSTMQEGVQNMPQAPSAQTESNSDQNTEIVDKDHTTSERVSSDAQNTEDNQVLDININCLGTECSISIPDQQNSIIIDNSLDSTNVKPTIQGDCSMNKPDIFDANKDCENLTKTNISQGTALTNAIREDQNERQKVLTKCDSRTVGIMDTIEISDEDNSEQM